MDRNTLIRLFALRIALPFALLGGAWIWLSDRFLAWLIQDVESLSALQSYKGWFFVVASSFFIYIISTRLVSKVVRYALNYQQSQHALTESKRTLQTLTRNLPGMTYRCSNDEDWTMEYVSDSSLQLTGYSPEEITGNEVISYGRIIIPEDREQVWQQVQQALGERRPFQLEYRIQTRSGHVKWVWEQGCGVFSDRGDLVALEGYIFDVSEKKNLETKLRESERLKSIGEAASTIIHDMKSPMQVILGNEELLRKSEHSTEISKHSEVVEKQVRRMVSMSRELLDYARGEISLDIKVTDIQELINQLVETYGPTFANSEVTLIRTVSRERGASSMIAIDRERIWRVLMNLIGNAREAMPYGGQITIRSLINHPEVRIEVKDDGKGIPDEIRPLLFNAFVTSGKSGGTGLGLAISKKIIEAHEGTISYVSAKNSGTTFIITLPRRHQVNAIQDASTKSLSYADALK